MCVFNPNPQPQPQPMEAPNRPTCVGDEERGQREAGDRVFEELAHQVARLLEGLELWRGNGGREVHGEELGVREVSPLKRARDHELIHEQ